MEIWRNQEDVLKIRRFCHQHGGDGGAKLEYRLLLCPVTAHAAEISLNVMLNHNKTNKQHTIYWDIFSSDNFSENGLRKCYFCYFKRSP